MLLILLSVALLALNSVQSTNQGKKTFAGSGSYDAPLGFGEHCRLEEEEGVMERKMGLHNSHDVIRTAVSFFHAKALYSLKFSLGQTKN